MGLEDRPKGIPIPKAGKVGVNMFSEMNLPTLNFWSASYFAASETYKWLIVSRLRDGTAHTCRAAEQEHAERAAIDCRRIPNPADCGL